MAQLRPILKTLSRGEKTFDEARSALESLIATSPESIPALLTELDQAQQAGLPRNMVTTLREVLENAQRDEDEFSKTLVPGAAIAGQVAPAQDASSASAVDPDATVLGTEQVAEAIAAQSGTRATDPDATVLGSAEAVQSAVDRAPNRDPDATVLAPDETSVPGGDATVLAGDDGADATAVTAVDMDAGSAGQAHAAGASAIDDATVLEPQPGGGDATVATAGGDKTEAADFDIFDPAAMQAAEEAAKATTGGSTGASWPTSVPDASAAPQPFVEFAEGSMLRGRFKLEKKLGEGGMGAVWQGTDLLKVEARDRNPWVAIKLLQGDFKEHPESFIALQRETAKQQRLAHPNIATVFDFDRDTDTGTVFMTMEVLSGQDLAGEIRRLPKDGLSLEDAMPYIEDLCAGLKYAHDAGLVHSDLKPGNCFVTKDETKPNGKTVKLLDFGIARASKTKADASGEQTVFDPGELGALTPTYATVEMFEGVDPDPRDDIYALAIMAYQLLTGKHPYGKQSAPKAMEAKLQPEYVSKVDKRQNRALRHGLEFLRENRAPTVEEFLDEIRPKKSYVWQITAGVAALLALVAVLLIPRINEYLIQKQMDESAQAIIACVQAGQESCLMQQLAAAGSAFDTEHFKSLKDEQEVKDNIMRFYEARKDSAWDPESDSYDYPTAISEIKALKGIYPNDAQPVVMENQLKQIKDETLRNLANEYQDMLDKGLLVPLKGKRSITDVLNTVRQIDENHELLTDKELPIKYADFVEQAISEKKWRVAKAYLDAGKQFAPDDKRLGNLGDTVETELERRRDAKEIAEIEGRLQKRIDANALESLGGFQRVRNDLIRLADLDPTNKVLVRLEQNLRRAFDQELARRVEAKAWPKSEKLLADFAKLLDIPYITARRSTLSQAEQKAGYTAKIDTRRVEERMSTVKKLLAEPLFTGEWEIALGVPYKELVALLPAGDETLAPIRDKTAGLFAAKAKAARDAGRFTKAREFLTRGERFYPGYAGFKREAQAVASAEETLKKQQEEQRRLAQIKKLKKQLLADAEALAVKDANAKLQQLRKALPANDPFITKDGPQAVALAYQKLAKQALDKKEWDTAITFHDAGFALSRDLPEIKEQHTRIEDLKKKRALIVAVRKELSQKPLDKISYATISKSFSAIKKQFPGESKKLRKDFDTIVGNRFKKLAAKDLAKAYAVRDKAKSTFPALGRVKLAALPCGADCKAVKKLIVAAKLTAAETALSKAASKHGKDHPDVLGVGKQLAASKAKAEDYAKRMASEEKKGGKKSLRKALQLVDAAIKVWGDNSGYVKDKKRIEDKINVNPYTCTAGKAGKGARPKGACYDHLGKTRKKGPLLAVIPKGGGANKVFAIGKQEVSVGEYNLVCKTAKTCATIKGKKSLPVTGTSLKDAEGYIQGLSKLTDQTYRLPTEAEWELAAKAGGKQPKKNFNCTVKSADGGILKGKNLSSVKSRDQNGWGLVNYVGNAREWVKSGGGVKVRGGSHKDSLSKCDIALSEAHSGAADGITGFRVVREIN